MTAPEKSRPHPSERWTDGMRTEPAVIHVRTEWQYAEPDPRAVLPEGRTRHPFHRGGRVTASDAPTAAAHLQGVNDHVNRAIAEFGDDQDLVIEIRPAGTPTAPPVTDPYEVLNQIRAEVDELTRQGYPTGILLRLLAPHTTTNPNPNPES